jgi:ubiquinone/menaquinone biosynthesis C-methylase UbiE
MASKKSSLSTSEIDQKNHFDQWANEYDKFYSDSIAQKYYKYFVWDRFLKNITLNGKQVLDAFCGTGVTSAWLYSKGAFVTGLDISTKNCELYKKNFPQNNVIEASFLSSGIADASFDCVIISNGLHHFPEMLDEILKEVHRILKPDSVFIALDPYQGSIFDFFRGIWYRYDKKFFEPNEQSINIKKMSQISSLQLN